MNKNIIEQIIPFRPQTRTARGGQGGVRLPPCWPAEPSKIVEKVTKKDPIFQKKSPAAGILILVSLN